MSGLTESIRRADDGGHLAQMLALCEQGLREQPNLAVIWALRARYHDQRGANAQRDADLDRALALDPQCSDAIRLRVTALYDAGQQQQAWRMLREAKTRAPSHFGLLMAEGYLLINDGQRKSEVDYLKKALAEIAQFLAVSFRGRQLSPESRLVPPHHTVVST